MNVSMLHKISCLYFKADFNSHNISVLHFAVIYHPIPDDQCIQPQVLLFVSLEICGFPPAVHGRRGVGKGFFPRSRKYSALVISLLNRIPVFIHSSRIIHSYLNTYVERKSMEKETKHICKVYA
jgi:hypothetical protein